MMHAGKDKGSNLTHCRKEKDTICTLALPTMHQFGVSIRYGSRNKIKQSFLLF